jgi:hypothetical protein
MNASLLLLLSLLAAAGPRRVSSLPQGYGGGGGVPQPQPQQQCRVVNTVEYAESTVPDCKTTYE